jgi:general stress protein CsbA
VFITFSLTELGMSRHWIEERKRIPNWKRLLLIHGTGLVMCVSILTIILIEKFKDGGWVTIAVTGVVIGFCFLIKRHYRKASEGLKRLDDILTATPMPDKPPAEVKPLDRKTPVAVITVSSFSGFGLHQILSIQKLFPNYFKQFIFVAVGVVDSGNFKGAVEIEKLEEKTKSEMEQYVEWCRRHGLNAESRVVIDNEIVTTVEAICREIAREYPRAIFFGGKLIFQKELWYHRFLHNETPFSIQRRLQFDGIQMIILPIRVL